MWELAHTLYSRDKLEEAEQIFQDLVGLQRRIQGAEHRDTLATMNSLALVLSKQKKYENAESLSRLVL